MHAQCLLCKAGHIWSNYQSHGAECNALHTYLLVFLSSIAGMECERSPGNLFMHVPDAPRAGPV